MFKKITHIGVYSLVYTLLYFVCSFAIWEYQKFSDTGALGIYSNLSVYIQKHPELKNTVFTELFSLANQCNVQVDNTQKKQCQIEIQKRLGNVIIEEELTINGHNWPNDLFFVKKEKNIYTKLDWQGELTDITHIVQAQNIRSGILYKLILLGLSSCDATFNVYEQNTYSCEIYERITIDENSYGYLVRLSPLVEENEFIFSLMMPVFALLSFGHFSTSLYHLGFYGLVVLQLILPISGTSYIMKQLQKNGLFNN